MTDLIGRTLGKYQIVVRVGRGGMARVYKAYQASLDRYVALKVLHTHLAEESDFVQSARSAFPPHCVTPASCKFSIMTSKTIITTSSWSLSKVRR